MHLLILYFKKLSLGRILNYILLRLEYCIALVSKKPIIHAKPFAASIEPATSCNLHCPECPTGTNEKRISATNISLSTFQKMLNPLLPELFYLNLYFQGEPFLNKDLMKMIGYANNKKIITNVSTNGHFINESTIEDLIKSKLDRIIISIDGASAESYQKYRIGGNFETVLNGIKLLVEKKKQSKSIAPYIEIQFIVFSSNEHEIPLIKTIAKQLEVDKLTLKTAQLNTYKEGNSLMPSTKYSRYKKLSDGTYARKKGIKNKCWKHWSSIVIGADGNVLPCCFDKHGLYAYGNIFEQGFSTIWNGDKAIRFRKKVLQNRKNISICTNCTE